MKVVLVIFYSPEELGVEFEDEKIQKDKCFNILRYPDEGTCLWAYANKKCLWSVIKDENDDLQHFIDEAWEHIQNQDYEWLESNFV